MWQPLQFVAQPRIGLLTVDLGGLDQTVDLRTGRLVFGSERAVRRAAAILSLLATAKLNGIEPSAWLKYTLEKLPI